MASTAPHKQMRVAVLQPQCDDTGDKQKNMKTIEELVEGAMAQLREDDDADARDKVILCPEFAVCGYSYDFDMMWSVAEPQGGPTERFLSRLAAAHGIYIGASYMEVREMDGECHYLNTFTLCGPDGNVRGRVCKATPCSVEAYFFTAPTPSPECSTPHVLEFDGYRVGVLICYENFLYDALRELETADQLDLLLQPFSGPLADDGQPKLKELLVEMYLTACPSNAQFLGCPAMYATKVGAWSQPSPSTFLPMTFDTEFPGCSGICDASGQELVRLSATECGTAWSTVELGRARLEHECEPRKEVPRFWGGYTHSSPFLKVCKVYEWLGGRYYRSSDKRKEMGAAVLSGTGSTSAADEGEQDR